MKKRILFFDFPEGVNTVFIDGKRYNRHQYELARNREKRRLKNGRFSFHYYAHCVQQTLIRCTQKLPRLHHGCLL